MNARAIDALALLTEREKQTLRLIVRGHDAKSIARELDLSVHTINERLRDARRKLAVPSSREAARLLLEQEDPQISVPPIMREAARAVTVPPSAAPEAEARRTRLAGFTVGGVIMTILLGILGLAVQPQLAPAPTAAAQTADAAVEAAARQFLTLVDQGRWDDSYRLTGAAFQKLNTAKIWADVSRKVRPPLGALVSRTLLTQENLPAPPRGYEVVKYRTSFANKADAVETVTLEQEAGGWKVVGVTIG